MSSGKSGSGKRTVYCGTISGVLGEGPAHSFRQFLVNAKAVWTGPLLRAGASNPTTITLTGYGNAQVYFGTEDQSVSSVLSKYALQPAYRGSVVVVLDDIRFGNSGETNPPNLEVVWRREPDQDIVTTLTADACFTVTIPAHAAELLTSWSWAGLPASALNIPSFTALEAALAGDPRNAIAPLYSDQCSVRSALADCAAIADAWLRIDPAGKIEVGLWPRGGPVATVTSFDFEDFTESPEYEVDDSSSLPNAISVEFRDSSKLHKANATLIPDSAAIRRAGGRVRRQTAKRSMLNTLAAAKRYGADLLASESRPGVVITASVFRSLAVRPDGQRIRPGDYFIAPVQLLPELPAVPRLFRCTRRSFGVRGPIKLTGELDRSAPAAAAIEAGAVEELERVLPPVNWVRVFAAPAGSAELPPVYVVAARPADSVTGYDVRYDDSAAGDFPALGNEPGCALPLLLQADCSAAATEVTVRLLPVTAAGATPRRDEHVLRNWAGGLVEARDDRLLLVILKIAGDGQIEWSGTGATAAEYAEILSVAGPATIVDADTFTVPVLRGRKGTPARAFTGGAWSGVEAWLVPSGSLQAMRHDDWTAAATAGTTLYFRFRPYALGIEYLGETAFAERQRRAAASEALEEYSAQPAQPDAPTVPYRIPAGYLPGMSDGDGDTYSDEIPGLWPAAATISTACKVRGGVATLIGWEPFIGQTSIPWVTYLTCATGGAGTSQSYTDCTCTTPGAPVVNCYNDGIESYDALTGVKSGQMQGHCDAPVITYNVSAPLTPTCTLAVANTATRSQGSSTGACCCDSYGSGIKPTSNDFFFQLSNQDNDTNAKTRLLAGLPGWGAIEAGSCVGASAIWGTRGASLSFAYRDAVLYVDGVGYLLGWEYFARVTWGRRAAGSADEYAAFQTSDYSLPADGTTGAFHEEIEYPNEQGWETCVLNLEVIG